MKPLEYKRRIWSEFVPYTVLCSPPVIELLQRYELQVLVAVTPDQVAGVPVLLKDLGEAGVDVGLWPMVSDSQGRWGSTANADIFAEFVVKVAQMAPVGTTIGIDLEPPLSILQGLLKGQIAAYRSLAQTRSWREGQGTLYRLVASLREQGYPCLAAANPMILGDQRGAGWQWLLGTPVHGLPFNRVSFMAYTSLLEGYGRRCISRRVACTMLAMTAMAAKKQWPHRASISLGTVGGGALGDESPYKSVAELAFDVGVVRTCGIDDLALFDLSGVLQEADPQAWLDAFVLTPPLGAATLPNSKRARILKASLKVGAAAIFWYR